MKLNHRGWKISGYYGPDMGHGKWLFARIGKGSSYPVAKIHDGQIVAIEPEQQFSAYTNREMAEMLLAAEQK
ncbi:MAG: hypothetical protein ACYTBJ_26255 [Planctomycetota bacterium]